MPEYIERAELMKFPIRIDHYDKEHGNVNFVYGVETVLEYAKNIPAADVVPVVHGRWVQVICHVEFEDGFVDRLYECCSRCHKSNGRKTSDYCPNCGAKMDGE